MLRFDVQRNFTYLAHGDMRYALLDSYGNLNDHLYQAFQIIKHSGLRRAHLCDVSARTFSLLNVMDLEAA